MSTDPGCVYLNGEYVRPQQARISPFDLGFLYGDGLFETLRTYGGQPFRLSAHLRRLEDGARTLALRGAPSQEALAAIVLETLRRAALPEAYVRVTLTRGVSMQGLDVSACDAPTVMVAALPLRTWAPAVYERGASLTVLWSRAVSDQPPPTVKSTSYQRAVLARAQVQQRGADEGLYLDEAGRVLEGTTSNVFAVRDGALLTAPADVCLPGITRAEVLELARREGLRTVEEAQEVAALQQADEIFITSSLAELVPVVRVDGAVIGGGAPGPVYRKLHALYRERTSECAA